MGAGSCGMLIGRRCEGNRENDEQLSDRWIVSQPRHKNKDAPRVGHPELVRLQAVRGLERLFGEERLSFYGAVALLDEHLNLALGRVELLLARR